MGLFTRLLFTTFLTCVSSLSFAAIVAQKSSEDWNPSRPTHVIIAAKGLAFASVGYQQFKIYQELYPENQFLFITNLPAPGPYRNVKQDTLNRLGFAITEESSTLLDTKKLIQILKSSTRNIRSLDIIGHNGVVLGPWLENDKLRMDFKNVALMSQLRPLFGKNAWARISGCNSGWYVAPALSEAWQIPVLGSFTSTGFYYLNTQGDYELFDSIDGGQASDNVHPAKYDNSFETPQKCTEGTCFTLKPEAAPYHLHVHKSPQAAWLPFVKPVCAKAIASARCQAAQAEAIIASIAPFARKEVLQNPEIFESMVYHSICGSYSKASGQADCTRKMKEAYENKVSYFPYSLGTQLKCSGIRGCSFRHISIDLRKNSPESTNDTTASYIANAFIGYSLLQSGSL